MPVDFHLRRSTRHVFGKKKQHALNCKRTPLQDVLSASPTMPLEVDVQRSMSGSPVTLPEPDVERSSTGSPTTFPEQDVPRSSSPSTSFARDVAGPSASKNFRIDTVFYTPNQCTAHSEQSDGAKRKLAGQSAKQCKFELLDANLSHEKLKPDMDFVVVDMTVLNNLFAKTLLAKCGMQPFMIGKSNRQFRLAVKLELTCKKCKAQEACFSLPRVED